MKFLRLLLVLVLLSSCNNKQKKNSDKEANSQIQNSVAFDSTKTDSFFEKFPKLKIAKSEVISFYQTQKYSYVWFDDSKINDQSKVLVKKIQTINEEGFTEQAFYTNDLIGLINSKTVQNPNLETELMLTAHYFIYAKKVWSGLSERETKNINWHLPRKKLDYNKLLDSIIKGNPVLENPPIYKQYSLLKTQLKKYQIIKQKGGFPEIDSKIVNLKIGDSSAFIVNLKKWFLLSEDMASSTSTQIYDVNVQTAIKNIQDRLGLQIDGKLTKSLVKEMNVDIEQRIREIALNMERCRWLPIENKTDFLVVNIPEYKMHVYENNTLIWSMNAVVGKANHETAIFADKLQNIVFSPYWNVPKGILKNEILPGIAKDKNYLEKHDMEWSNGLVRQKPGPKNSLGLVKFLFPNNFDIYLHDTPAKSLFNRNDRAYSHGCIRLENAEKLANYLLKNDDKWNAEKIKTAMNSGEEKFVKVQKNEAVFIVYITTWVDVKGKLNFRKDIYKRDNNLATLLFS